MELATDKALVLFDGVCNLCNSSVQLIIKNDRKDQFRFAALQSELGKKILAQHDIKTDSIILVEKDKVYMRSTAALRIAKRMDGAYPLLYVFILVPKFVRDYFYNIVARKRYIWYGKQEECMLPTPALKKKFLD